eukprot:GHVT01001150.1.p1 GENE.GHVT01001150.1~~GHVT01001150.1.p1  ORF type:complete len:320 (+),score=46.57 GHVT01001150.1:305-1264(+)
MDAPGVPKLGGLAGPRHRRALGEASSPSYSLAIAAATVKTAKGGAAPPRWGVGDGPPSRPATAGRGKVPEAIGFLVAGTAGGVAQTLVGHPFNTIKVRMQAGTFKGHSDEAIPETRGEATAKPTGLGTAPESTRGAGRGTGEATAVKGAVGAAPRPRLRRLPFLSAARPPLGALDCAKVSSASFKSHYTVWPKNKNQALIVGRISTSFPPYCLLLVGISKPAPVAFKGRMECPCRRTPRQNFSSRKSAWVAPVSCRGACFHVSQITLKEEGVRGFYRGVTPPLFGIGLINAVLFFGNEIAKDFLTPKEETTGTANLRAY